MPPTMFEGSFHLHFEDAISKNLTSLLLKKLTIKQLHDEARPSKSYQNKEIFFQNCTSFDWLERQSIQTKSQL